MQILKHQKNGRLFVATPALLKNKNMIPASPEESSEYIGSLDETKRELLENSKSAQAADLMMPKGLDPKVNIKTWGKPQLLALANKINLNIPATLKVKDIKVLVQDGLDKLAENEEKSPETGDVE